MLGTEREFRKLGVGLRVKIYDGGARPGSHFESPRESWSGPDLVNRCLSNPGLGVYTQITGLMFSVFGHGTNGLKSN